jgi:hypothetical protein
LALTFSIGQPPVVHKARLAPRRAQEHPDVLSIAQKRAAVITTAG